MVNMDPCSHHQTLFEVTKAMDPLCVSSWPSQPHHFPIVLNMDTMKEDAPPPGRGMGGSEAHQLVLRNFREGALFFPKLAFFSKTVQRQNPGTAYLQSMPGLMPSEQPCERYFTLSTEKTGVNLSSTNIP